MGPTRYVTSMEKFWIVIFFLTPLGNIHGWTERIVLMRNASDVSSTGIAQICDDVKKTFSTKTASTFVWLLQRAGLVMRTRPHIWTIHLDPRALPLNICQLPDSELGPSRDFDSSCKTAFGKSRKPKRNENLKIKNIVNGCCIQATKFKLLKPTCCVMHQQFIIQQLYVLPTLYLCVLYLSENKQRLVPLTA